MSSAESNLDGALAQMSLARSPDRTVDSTHSHVYAIWFTSEHLSFVQSEWIAVTEALGIEFEPVPWSSDLATMSTAAISMQNARQLYAQGGSTKKIHDPDLPTWDCPFALFYVSGGVDAVERICRRCVSVKEAWELWAEAPTVEECTAHLMSAAGRSKWDPVSEQRLSWRFEMLGYGYKPVPSEMQHDLRVLTPFSEAVKGDIKMKGAEMVIGVVQIHQQGAARLINKKERQEKILQSTFKAAPHHIFIGRKLKLDLGRDLVTSMDVKQRVYIGNTTMETEMALRMALMGLAGPGKIVYDPFVGTGSTLHAAAAFGAWVVGAELDMRALQGKDLGKGRPGILRAADQYGFAHRFLDCVCMDFTQPAWRRGVFSEGGLVDAIITDPPYGVRAGAKKLGYRNGPRYGEDKPMILPDGTPAHLAPDWSWPTRAYHLSDLLQDLMEQAARLLKDNGRLVFFVPSIGEDQLATQVPEHPDLVMVCKNDQVYSTWRRILVTLRRKPRTTTAAPAEAFVSAGTRSAFAKGNSDPNEFRNLFFRPRAERERRSEA